jgi:hypothetical protein
VELYFHFPNTPPWRGAQLKHSDNFTFNVIIPELHVKPGYELEYDG